MVLNARVLKEPRGFIRIIQCVMAILAFSTTAGFDTSCSFLHSCGETQVQPITYSFGYPFQITDNELTISHSCEETEEETTTIDDDDQTIRLPFDYSSSSEFYVATGVLSFLYTILALVVYVFFHQTYSTDPKLPVVDLGITAIITVFWLAGSSAWARGVQDLKYYLHPENLFGLIYPCRGNACTVVEEGRYAILNVSLVFGFACFALWLASMWFIFKETVFHTPAEAAPDTNQKPTDKGDGRV